ncbi:MAG TPA: AAA family ATPase, partial [Kofleriaceae bacterium]
LQQGRTQLTQTGTTIGTPGYMAPEQARSNAPIDARADVFALGCVLFRCLTGTPAFEGDSVIAILGKILFGEAPRVSALWPEVPEDLDALVARMLAKDPSLRPSDGADLAAALAALGPWPHSSAVAAVKQPAQLSSLTGGERRFLSVVLLGSAADGSGPAEAENEAENEAALGRALKPYGGRMEQLADGPILVVLEADRRVATDQAAQAARCALAMRAVVGDRPIAIAMGRADPTRKLPDGEVITRASSLIQRRATAPGGAPPIDPTGEDPRPAGNAVGVPTPRRSAPPIALDEVSAGLLDARFDVVEDDAGLLLLGERPVMQGARTLLGRPTSCVGRDWELGVLTGILAECIEEPDARVAIVTAAAGMGKSRLAAEFVSHVQQHSPEIAIWVGRGDSLRAGSTLDLLAQALRGALGIHGGEPLAERRDQIRRRVAEHVPAAEHERVAEFLGELVGTPFPDDDEAGASGGPGARGAALRAARQDAQLMSEQMRKAWIDFLDAETSAHPVLLVLEDLHWGDFGTARFIDTALRDRGERPWMVLALARPEVFEVFPQLWADRQNVQEIRLQELRRKAGARLVRQVLGDSVGTETMEHLVKQADGNAFYLEELIRAAAEGKGKGDLLPETVLAMVETRLGRLAVDARRVLRAASVFGEVCWESGVALLLEGAMGATMVGEWLTQLAEQEVLVMRPVSRVPGEREFAFRHSLLREGAYATLTEHDKRLGHRLAGEWLVRHGEGDPMVLAGHFERGGQAERAASYYLRAAEQSLYLLVDVDASISRADLGLGCAPTPELRIALQGIRCEAATFSLGKTADMIADAEELMRSAPRGSIPWIQGVAVYNYGTLMAGRMEDLLPSIALLRQVDPAPGAVGKMAFTLLMGTCVLDNLGQVAEGSVLEQRFSEIIPPTEPRESLARVWWNIAIGMRGSYAHEDPWSALQHSDAIRAIYEAIGGDLIFMNMQLFRALNRWYLGRFMDAERILEADAMRPADALGMASALRRFCLSWLFASRGALDEARSMATELSEHGRARHNSLDEGRGRWVLAEVLRCIGDLDGADREIQAALGLAMALDHPGVLATLSTLRLAQGRAGEALAAADE